MCFPIVWLFCFFIGPFLESIEGRIVLPSISGPILQHVVGYLCAQHARKYYSVRSLDARDLVLLLEAAHFLSLELLVQKAARGISGRMGELTDPFHRLAEPLLVVLLPLLSASWLCNAETVLGQRSPFHPVYVPEIPRF